MRNRFPQGNQAAKKRKHRRGGRPNKAQAEAKKLEAEVKRLAADLAKKYLEDHLKPILDTYISLATGSPSGKKRCKLDPATTRHYVERFVGPAPRSLILDLQDSVESFFEQVEKMGSEENEV